MPAEEDLVRGIEGLHRTAMDFGNVVDGGRHHDEDDPGNGFRDEKGSVSLQAVQRHDREVPQRGIEEEDQDQHHFPQYRPEE